MSSDNRQVQFKRLDGCGTSFRIFLQASDNAVHNRVAGPDQPKAPSQTPCSEHIMVVDDEKNLLHIWKDILIHFGYRVTTALSGEEALEIFTGLEPDLVILDMNMPGMGGTECLERLMQVNPSARVIISSGCHEDTEIERAFGLGAQGFLEKPFSVDSLLGEIRRILDSDEGGDVQKLKN
jgi:two-component system, cell cycle sensor histidine kinase and response regulator CckA